MNAHASPRPTRRAPRRAAFALAAALALLAGSPAARAQASPPPAPGPVSCRPTFAGWQQLVLGNRSRMIQIATVIMVVGIFILTRGRWKS
jgi:hypothetical protein